MEHNRPDIHLLLLILILFSISIGILHGRWRTQKLAPTHENPESLVVAHNKPRTQ